MNWSGKSVLFAALNLFFIGWLAVILTLLLRVLNGEDPLALFGVLVADIAFLGVGIGLALLNKSYPIAAANRLLPFIAFIGLTAVAVMNVSDATLWFGVGLSVALIIASIITAVAVLGRRS